MSRISSSSLFFTSISSALHHFSEQKNVSLFSKMV